MIGFIFVGRFLSKALVRARGALSFGFLWTVLPKGVDSMTQWKTLPAHLHVLSVALLSTPGARLAFLMLVAALASWAQDPFSSLGASAQMISTGTFVTGLVEFAIVIAGLLLAFSGRVLGGVLVAIVGGGMLALSAAKWEGWIQGL
jgi:hypothetical protein